MTLILAAGGVGSRVRELTGDLPKCLFPVLGKPLLFHMADRLGQTMDLDRVIIVGKHGNPYGERIAEELRAYLRPQGSEVSLTTTTGRGVGSSLWAGVTRALERECPRALLTVSDTIVDGYASVVSSMAPVAIGVSPIPVGEKKYTLVGISDDGTPQFEPAGGQTLHAVSGVYGVTGESLALFADLFREATSDPDAFPDVRNEKGEFRVTWVWKAKMQRGVQARCEHVGDLAEPNMPKDLRPMIDFLRRST